MVKIIFLIFFSLANIYNWFLWSQNRLPTKKKPIIWLALALLGLVALYLAATLDKSLMGYLISIMAVGLALSLTLAPGITNRGINVMRGNLLIKRIRFQDIRAIGIIAKDEADLTIRLDAHGNTYQQTYDIKDKRRLKELLQASKLSLAEGPLA